MKIFKFDPITGKRGEQINSVKVASWGSTGVNYANSEGIIEPITFKVPDIVGQEWVAHLDGGSMTNQGNDISYQHPTEWICYCDGEMHCGTDSYWSWVVLPPKNAIVRLVADESRPVNYNIWNKENNNG